jgi:hypothetical protein
MYHIHHIHYLIDIQNIFYYNVFKLEIVMKFICAFLTFLAFNLSVSGAEEWNRTRLMDNPIFHFANARINLSDELPPNFAPSPASNLDLTTVQSTNYSRPKHGINYPEIFPHLKNLRLWDFRSNPSSIDNIDFESLSQLHCLSQIEFHMHINDDQIQLFAPLQHMENLQITFYLREKEVSWDRMALLQQFLPNAEVKTLLLQHQAFDDWDN